MEVGLNYLKEIIMGVLFFATLLCVSIPMKLALNAQRSGIDIFNSERYSKIVSLLNCFAAGIFLGTCLLHLFPDVRQNVTAAVALIDPSQTFPFAEFTIVLGFLMLLTIEQIMSDIRERRLEKLTLLPPRPASNSTTVAIQPQSQLPSIQETDEDNSIDDRSYNNLDNSVLIETVQSNSFVHRSESRNQQQQHQHHGEDLHEDQIADQHSLRVVAMIIAISIHSVFEGIAIGVQATEEEVLQITSALAIHKLVISFSIGLSLTQSSLKTYKSVIFGVIFASATPVGTAIGLAVTIYENDLNNSLIVGVLQGFAAGTFLYVTFLDVLPHEFKGHGKLHLPKLLSFIVGFSVICASLFVFPDS